MDRKYLMQLQCAVDLEIRKIEEKDIRQLFEDARSLVSSAYLLELGNDFKKNFLKIISLKSILESKFYAPGSEMHKNEKYNMIIIDEVIGLGDSYADDENIIIKRRKNDKTNW